MHPHAKRTYPHTMPLITITNRGKAPGFLSSMCVQSSCCHIWCWWYADKSATAHTFSQCVCWFCGRTQLHHRSLLTTLLSCVCGKHVNIIVLMGLWHDTAKALTYIEPCFSCNNMLEARCARIILFFLCSVSLVLVAWEAQDTKRTTLEQKARTFR